MNVQQKADALPPDVFLGGPRNLFGAIGRLQLISLLDEGLEPNSKVLDVGCGCLRGGYWLIHFLAPGHYYGIEPNAEMLRLGREYFLPPETLEEKKPTFDGNADFDFEVFGVEFDFFLARSVWTHASKSQIEAMLDGFVQTAAPGAVFLTSYLRAFRHEDDYEGTDWVGRSHESNDPGVIRHRLEWIEGVCHTRELVVEEANADPVNSQRWLRITRASEARRDPDDSLFSKRRRTAMPESWYRLPKRWRAPLARVRRAARRG